ncbi:hypothetical protein [Citricoccus alkalitolerans]|uniref:Uncharacterized protein n=1 Tax=Citricoccus alkalitolerans TaxID=246603 RepID=A0ABV8Y2I3_9MICC
MDTSLVSQIVIAAATLLASLGGYVLAGRNENRRDARTMHRELQLRNSERAARLDDQRHALQRETLLALQDAVQAMARFTSQIMHFDHMQARQGEYTHLPGTLSDDSYANLVEVRRLQSRILDANVRDAVDRCVLLSRRLSTSPSDLEGLSGENLERHVMTKFGEFHDGYESASNILGEAVRREIAWQPLTA